MLTGWLNIDNSSTKKNYYFDADGSLARNAIIDGYKIDEDGMRKKNKTHRWYSGKILPCTNKNQGGL
ncbi:hypothetical protein [Sporanaerobacter sp. PP17-6a]|uniref:hypothetical protein n=1 Tax=Sporanaerobacter sp. PP17-6a TaxID=1891289 RepID=UPI00115F9320|nr:hypothetical protein [Sporanaerobacter sp. PP17-6a]